MVEGVEDWKVCANEDLRYRFYEQMYLTRFVEESLLKLFSRGELHGTIHTCLGQEACAVGVIAALDLDRDLIFSNHRGHGHFIAYSDDVEGLIAEVMGKATGVCSGVGGSQHLHKVGFYSSGVQGGMVPAAVGAAMAEKLKKTGAVVAVFIGDGTFGQGVVYESFNIAALYSAPILFVAEDNKYAQSTPKHMHLAGDIVGRGKPFGIETFGISGDDVFYVYETTRQLVDNTRQYSQPHLLVLDTYRLGPHSKGDDTRPSEEIDQHRCQDPLTKLKNTLLDSTRCREIERRVQCRVEAAISKARSSPLLSIDSFSERIRN